MSTLTSYLSLVRDGLALDASILVLTTLGNAARASPLPYFQGAASLALGILNTIQSMKEIKESFKRLDADSYGPVYVIITRYSTSPKDLQSRHQDLFKNLLKKLGGDAPSSSSGSSRVIQTEAGYKSTGKPYGRLWIFLVKPLQSNNSTRESITSIIDAQAELLKHLREQKEQDSGLKNILTEVLEHNLAEKEEKPQIVCFVTSNIHIPWPPILLATELPQ